jgi:hypothetical protein
LTNPKTPRPQVSELRAAAAEAPALQEEAERLSAELEERAAADAARRAALEAQWREVRERGQRLEGDYEALAAARGEHEAAAARVDELRGEVRRRAGASTGAGPACALRGIAAVAASRRWLRRHAS